jgi:hypothetical protein
MPGRGAEFDVLEHHGEGDPFFSAAGVFHQATALTADRGDLRFDRGML